MRRRLYTKVEEPAPVRVLVPYTKPTVTLQLVLDCLRIQYVQPELVKVGDGAEYHTALADAWAAGEEFFVVEHDVVVWMGGIRQLAECDEDWCSLPTMCHGRLIPTTFGCVKFGKRMVEQNPGFWDDIDTTWFYLDAGFADKMGFPFIKPHAHMPPATHLNEVQWADDISTRWALERKIVWHGMESEDKTVVKVNYRLEGDRSSERVADAELDMVGGRRVNSAGRKG